MVSGTFTNHRACLLGHLHLHISRVDGGTTQKKETQRVLEAVKDESGDGGTQV